MGQRHQIYLFITDSETKKPFGTAIHHQWLYGHTAGLQVVRMMEYHKKTEKYNPLRNIPFHFRGEAEVTDCLKSFYSIIPEEGYYYSCSYMGDEAGDEYEKNAVNDPRLSDNNDGITVFDFTDPIHPTYCMMNIFEEREDKEGSVHALAPKTPVSVEQYVRAYYPKGGTEYQKKNWDKKDFAQNEKKLAKLFKSAKKFKVMTQTRACELMPGLYQD